MMHQSEIMLRVLERLISTPRRATILEQKLRGAGSTRRDAKRYPYSSRRQDERQRYAFQRAELKREMRVSQGD